MGLLADILLHPGELLPLLRVRREAKVLAAQTYEDEDVAFCYRMLNRLSKSFAFVIQQLPAAVRHAVRPAPSCPSRLPRLFCLSRPSCPSCPSCLSCPFYLSCLFCPSCISRPSCPSCLFCPSCPFCPFCLFCPSPPPLPLLPLLPVSSASRAFSIDSNASLSSSSPRPVLCPPSIVCVFYLVLRALDTVEDDMGVGNAEKIPILIAFHEHVTDPNWTYVCGTKDFRKLMQHLHHLRRALEKLDPKYRMVILDITKRMGAGMAMYITAEVETEQQYQDYCHYVAGLVGIGMSAIFHHSGLEPLADEDLSNTMGLFLQNTNIIRDYLEDIEEEPAPRMFWPRAIWGKYSQQLEDFKDVGANGTAAVQCLNDMVTIALSHAPHCLCFLAQVQDAQIFRFWAIPQVTPSPDSPSAVESSTASARLAAGPGHTEF
ncbi:unnamed protein product [Closterium sp. Naga37s-1]|nr:unnamed protein product [Closterium sp. Naga37s-1]